MSFKLVRCVSIWLDVSCDDLLLLLATALESARLLHALSHNITGRTE